MKRPCPSKTISGDDRLMAAALRLSARNEGLTAENPCVGCLIVRDGEIVGRGVTAPGGRPHAERIALDEAGDAARGATAYVTLEPCAHHGRTPPCADALVEAGVARVAIGAGDPDPRVAGQGAGRLRAAGIETVEGVLEVECRARMAGFLSRVERGRPHVLLKLAVSPDGFVGRAGEGNVPVTGPVARAQVHLMRARSDAIMVGAGTVRADDPALTVRLPGLEDRSPLRLVLSNDHRLSPDAALVRTAHEVPTVVLGSAPRTPGANERADALARANGALRLRGVSGPDHPAGSLEPILHDLAMDGVSTLMVEGGAAVARAFLDADLVDVIALFVGAMPLGGDVASPLAPDQVPEGFALGREDRFGPDRLMTMRRA